MSRFTQSLIVSPLSDGRTWVLLKDFGYDVKEEGSGEVIDVPVGFKTDFASVPRIFWAILPRWGRYGNAAVIHDYCYWDQTYSRKTSDRIFLEAMGVLGVPAIQKNILYGVVRWFGWGAWTWNRRKKTKNPDFKFEKNMTEFISVPVIKREP